jgi:outer membrane biosynthesis protein TonB
MRRSGIVIAAGLVLVVVGAGAATANILTVRDQPGATQSVEPIIATPDPTLPSATPEPSAEPTTPPQPAPIPPAPPEDVDDDDDDDPDDDDTDDG